MSARSLSQRATLTQSAENSSYEPRKVFRQSFAEALDARWVIVRPDSTSARLAGGALQIDTVLGDLTGINGSDNAKNLYLLPLPDGPWTAEVAMYAPLSTDSQHAGMYAFRDGSDHVAAEYWRRPSTTVRVINRYRRNTTNRLESGYDYNDVTFTTPMQKVRWRMVCDGRQIVSFSSTDGGTTWTVLGRPAPAREFTHIGLVAYATNTSVPADTVRFDDFTLKYEATPTVRLPVKELNPYTATGNPLPTIPTDTLSTAVLAALRQTDKYTVNTWYPAAFGSQSAATYLNFGGVDENSVRPSAAAAFGLACSLGTLGYSSSVAVQSSSAARAIALKLIRSVAYAHKSNSPVVGWGYDNSNAQSALWASLAGVAGWLLWEYLSPTDQEYVRRMVVAEATYRLRRDPGWYKDTTGAVTAGRTGDTAAEENAWNSMVLQLAVVMMPNHARRPEWMRRCIDLIVASWVAPSDLTSTTMINGQPLKDYLKGSNVADDGTLVNHNLIHPDYMAAAPLSLQAALLFAMAGRPAPTAVTVGINRLYNAMVNVNFTAPPYNAPGGTIYVSGSPDLYYPQGNDWTSPTTGVSTRVADKAAFDVMVSKLGLDTGITPNAATWAGLHVGAVATLQARSTTGQTYTAAGEDTYTGREQWVAMNMGWAWLTCWVVQNSLYRLSNLPPHDL